MKDGGGLTYGDVLANVRDISPLKSGMRAKGRFGPPPEPMSKEYLHILAGCNIKFQPEAGSSKGELSQARTKLQAAPFDETMRTQSQAFYAAGKKESRRNKSHNMHDQIYKSFPYDAVNPFMRHSYGNMDSTGRKREAFSNYLRAGQDAQAYKRIGHGSMGERFLSDDLPEYRGETTQVRNPEKALSPSQAFYGAERSPGKRATVFQTMGKDNKQRDMVTNLDFTLPEKAAGENEWKVKYCTPPQVYLKPYERHMEKSAIREACSAQTISLRHIATPGSNLNRQEPLSRYSRRPAAWGNYSL